MKSKAFRVVRNIVLSVVVLVALLVGGGLAYTYFLGPEGGEEMAVTEPAPVASPVVKPTKPAANAKASASISVLTSPVAPGDNASVTIKTVATAKCTPVVTYNEVPAKDSGLAPKAADEFGTATWTWTVDKAAPLGTWPVKITCVYNGRSAVVQGDLVVKPATAAEAVAP